MKTKLLIKIIGIVCLLVTFSSVAQYPQSAFPLAVKLSTLADRNLAADASLYSADETLPPEKTADLDDWFRLQKPLDAISLLGGVYWFVLELENDTQQTDWVLDVENGLIEHIDYFFYSNQGRRDVASGFVEDDEFFLTYGRSFNIEEQATMTVLIRIESPYYASLPALSVTPIKEYEFYELIKMIVIMLSLGALLCLSIYNLFLYIGTRQTELLHYSGYLGSYFVAWALVFQIPAQVFNFHLLQVHYVPFFLLPFFSGRFCIGFLDLATSMPTTANVLRHVGNISIVAAIITLVAVSYAHIVATVLIGTWIGVAIYAGVVRWQQGFKPASYFLLGFLSLLIPACLILPANVGVVPDIINNSELVTLVGGTFDAILLAFAIAYRMRLIADENKVLTVELEDKVAVRTSELRALNRELTAANESKKQFLANVGHEVRTPMTSIIGFSELLKEGLESKEERQEYSRIIHSNGTHLLSIVNDLLDLSKIEAQKLTYNFTSVDVISLARQLVSEHKPIAGNKNIEITLNLNYPLPSHISCDEVRLRQILLNIVSNAIKFTDTGSVVLSLELREETIVFAVADSGIGMSEEQTHRLFQPFEQADNSIARRYGGTGLGLHISHQLAAGLGGKLDFQTEFSVGSTFYLEIPSRANHETQLLQSPFAKELSQITTNDDVPLDLSSVSVLLADDFESNRKLISLMLRRLNATVYTASDGLEALKLTQTRAIDLVLLDIQMPVMDGMSAMKAMKNAGFNKPIIALTANSMKHQVAEFIAAGFNTHVAKPIDTALFYDVIREQIDPLILQPEINNDPYADELTQITLAFVEELNSNVNLLEAACKQNDWARIRMISHQIRGCAVSYGFSEINALFEKLDRLIDVEVPDAPSVAEHLTKIADSCAEL